jgi:hypothetical protein
VPERIATFDNDGTLWAEQPMYFQAFFIFDRIKALAPQHPEWKDKEPFASVLKGDVKSALAGGENYNPHVSTGVAPKEYLDGMLAEPFETFTLSPAGAAVYQLGPFCTAAKLLKQFDLKP